MKKDLLPFFEYIINMLCTLERPVIKDYIISAIYLFSILQKCVMTFLEVLTFQCVPLTKQDKVILSLSLFIMLVLASRTIVIRSSRKKMRENPLHAYQPNFLS